MHVEGVATRCSGRPSRPAEALAAHDRAEPGEEGARQASLDRRERHPPRAQPEHPMVVEIGHDVVVGADAHLETGSAGADIVFERGNAGPVLQAVSRERRLLARFDQEQARHARGDQRVASGGLGRPAKKGNVHGTDRRSPTLPIRFVSVNSGAAVPTPS